MELLAERQRVLTVVEHDTTDEAPTRGLLQFPQPAEGGAGHGRPSFHFDAGHGVCAPLQHDVHLDAVTIPEVMEPDRVLLTTRLTVEFLKHKGFEELAKKRAFLREGIGTDAEQGGGGPDGDRGEPASANRRLLERLIASFEIG